METVQSDHRENRRVQSESKPGRSAKADGGSGTFHHVALFPVRDETLCSERDIGCAARGWGVRNGL